MNYKESSLDQLNKEKKKYAISSLEKILSFFQEQETSVLKECLSLEKLFKSSLPTRHMASNQLQSLKEKEKIKNEGLQEKKAPVIDTKLDSQIKTLIEQAETTLQGIEDNEKPRPIVKPTLQPYTEKNEVYQKKRQTLQNKVLPSPNSFNKPPSIGKPAVIMKTGASTTTNRKSGSSSSITRGSSVGPQGDRRASGSKKFEKKGSDHDGPVIKKKKEWQDPEPSIPATKDDSKNDTRQVVVPGKGENLEINSKPEIENAKKDGNEKNFFNFSWKNVKSLLDKEKLEVYSELKLNISKKKKEMNANIVYYKEKSIKAQSKFLNKMFSHYTTKKNMLVYKEIMKEKQKNRRNSEESDNQEPALLSLKQNPKWSEKYQIDKTLSSEQYILENYLKLLAYYLSDEESCEEFIILRTILKNKEHVKLGVEMFRAWYYKNYLEESVAEANKRVESYVLNSFSSFAKDLKALFMSSIKINKKEPKSLTFEKNEAYGPSQNLILFTEDLKASDRDKKHQTFKIYAKELPCSKQNGKEMKELRSLCIIYNENKLVEVTQKLYFELFLSEMMNQMSAAKREFNNLEKLKPFLSLLRVILINCKFKGLKFPLFVTKDSVKALGAGE